MKKSLHILPFLLFSTSLCFAQTTQEQFAKAKELYDNGNNKECIIALQAVEKQVGANPKIYSLYTNAYVADKDYINAAISLNKFKKLIGNKHTEAIQSILDLEKEINSGVELAEKKHKEIVTQKRMEEAEKIISSSKTKSDNLKTSLVSAYKSQTEEKAKNLTSDDVKEIAANLSLKDKADLYKALRSTKKIKKHWIISFSDKTLSKVSMIEYYEFNNNGDKSKIVVKRFTPSIDFSKELLEPTYISNIINNHEYDYSTILNYKTLTNLKNNKVEKITIEEDGYYNDGGYKKVHIKTTKWFNEKNELVKEVYENEQYQNRQESLFEYNDLGQRKNLKTTYFLNGKVNGKNTKTYEYDTPSESKYHSEYTASDGKKTISTGTDKKNHMGDLIEVFDNNSGKSSYLFANNYDRYGNVNYHTTFTPSTDDRRYYYNFYEYQDGYKSDYEDYIKIVEYLKSKQ